MISMGKDANSENFSLDEKLKLVGDTIKAYPLQLKQSWEEVNRLQIPEEFKESENIVFCGMGGSALGARMIKSLTFGQIRIPFEIFNHYKLPNYANKKSLVIVCSYSGSTEETVEATYEAINKGLQIFGITTGGRLAEILNKEKKASYIFEPKHNIAGQPRMAIGYASGAVLALLTKLGFVNYTNEDIEKVVLLMNELIGEYSEGAPKEKNLALSYADKLRNKAPIFVTSEHLFGTLYTIKNQFNETAKTFSDLFELPELNHHLLEGLKNPSNLRNSLIFVFINSDLFHERVKKRYLLTAEVVEKNGFEYLMYQPFSKDKLSQVYETLILWSFTVLYLTKLHQIDPLVIPWVDYFKERLAKNK